MSSRKLADTLVERYDLRPPVDVLALLEGVADVEHLVWEQSVDGLVLGLSHPGRPRAFLRMNQPLRRKRFTAAHEWGHISIPWHTESLESCHIDNSAYSALGVREREANEFASRVLMPDRYMKRLVTESLNVADWLQGVAYCDVSAHAGLISLVDYLPSGYTFALHQGDALSPKLFRSSGTPIVLSGGRKPLESLVASSFRSGKIDLNGKQVWWFQHIDTSLPPRGSASSAQLLAEIVSRYGRELRPGRPTDKAINSVIGGKLGRRDRMSLGQMLGVLKLHMQSDPDLQPLLADPIFEELLLVRVYEIAEKDKVSGRGQ